MPAAAKGPSRSDPGRPDAIFGTTRLHEVWTNRWSSSWAGRPLLGVSLDGLQALQQARSATTADVPPCSLELVNGDGRALALVPPGREPAHLIAPRGAPMVSQSARRVAGGGPPGRLLTHGVGPQDLISIPSPRRSFSFRKRACAPSQAELNHASTNAPSTSSSSTRRSTPPTSAAMSGPIGGRSTVHRQCRVDD